MQRVFDFLRTDDIPPVAARLYGAEVRYFMLWMLVVGAIEGNIAAIVAKKTFGASDLLTKVVWQAPIVMMALNLFWGAIMRGRRRLPLLVLLTSCAVLLIGSIAFTSPTWRPWGGWVFAAQIGLTHLFVTGIVTLQSSIWKVNYPKTQRGKIIGRLQTIRFMFVPLSGAAIAALFDQNPEYFRFVYPVVALVGGLALLPLKRLRIRGETRELREVRRHVGTENKTTAGRTGVLAGLWEAAGILRRDATYRRYMAAQFTLGAANFFTDPVLVTVLTGQLLFGYLGSSLIMQVIPGLMVWLSIQVWSGYFDRVGVLRFRVANCVVWIAAYVCVAVSMLIIGIAGKSLLYVAIPILIIGRMLKGTAHGGGTIAWSIGHLHFARKHQIDLYMSIHVALTGLRALLMPHIGGLANRLMGNGSFAISVAIAILALILFHRLAKMDPHPTHPDEAQTRATEPTTTNTNVT